MKAIVYSKYGPPEVLQLQETDKPVPETNEVLVRVRAVSVNYGDVIARNFRNISRHQFNMPSFLWIMARLGFGLNSPNRKILGNTFSGEIVSIGNEVKKLREGERVFGYTGEKMGTYAEYICIPENGIVAVGPRNLTHEEASVLPYGTIMALNLLRKSGVRKGQKIIVIGASGGIGSAAVQLAKVLFGAEVTGVCGTSCAEYVKNLGADRVIDYSKEDFTKGNEIYDLVFDVLGKRSFSEYKRMLAPKGTCFLVSFKTKKLLQMLITPLSGGKKVICSLAVPTRSDLVFIRDLVEEGKIKSIIDRCFPLEQASEAHEYFESGKRKASVVIAV